MGRLERIRNRVKSAVRRAGRKCGCTARVLFEGNAVDVCAAFAGVDAGGGENVAVGVVGDRARFLFDLDQWERVKGLVGDSLEFTVAFCGENWTPDFGAPVCVEPVAGLVTLFVCRSVVARQA